jgi:DtxR family transcriptional regulator, Mn-dependent transcriptional regulator
MKQHVKLSASQEDYLEAVYHIAKEKKVARAKDIAKRLDVRASSVTNALRMLSSLGLVNYAPYDLITLTDAGLSAAKEIVGRHTALSNFLVTVLGVDEAEADQAACKMEHSVPKSIVNRLIQYADYIAQCPRGGITWDSGFGYYCKTGCAPGACERGKSCDPSTPDCAEPPDV